MAVFANIARFFDFAGNQTRFSREILAGATTFTTMSYIIFVNPAILSTTGMDFGAVMVATCLAAALGSLFMALLANYPIALAPGMGLNAYFAFSICGGLGIKWQVALGGVFLSGVGFMLLAAFRFRERLISAIPESLKNAIAVGIGCFIAFIGLREGGLVVGDRATLVHLGDLGHPVALTTLLGLSATAVLLARRMTGALLIGIGLTGLLAAAFGLLEFRGVVSSPPSLAPTALQLDVAGAFGKGFFTIILVFLFVDLFDTVGTLVAVGEQGGFLRDGKLPRGGRALFADALATSVGAILGTSTTTSYIESASGISEGGRTGFANLVTAALFILAIFFAPLVQMLGNGVEVEGIRLHPVTAPALIIVGSLMAVNSMKIDWKDQTEAIPAFLMLLGIPLTFSIADGMALGFMAYPLIKLLSGRYREINPIVAALALAFAGRYFWLLR